MACCSSGSTGCCSSGSTCCSSGSTANNAHRAPDDLFQQCSAAADFIRSKLGNVASSSIASPEIMVVCGSGLGSLASSIETPIAIPYADIPNFPVCTAPSHVGQLVFGKMSERNIVAMLGRFHMYEGYPAWKCTLPIRVLKMMGVKKIILTTAVGGLNEKYKVGDIMVVKDHIGIPSLAGLGPLVGKNDDRLGIRFPGANKSYSNVAIKLAVQVASELGLSPLMHTGVYCMEGGPTFETIAECKMIRMLGADVVGMSTTPEVAVAVHSGLQVLVLALVTNMAIMDYEDDRLTNSEEVFETAKSREKEMQTLVTKIIKLY